MTVDLNHQSGFVYGRVAAPPPIGERIDALVNEALLAERALMPPRDYLGASRIGEPCARRLCYELMCAPVDEGAALSGRMLRIFEAGHRFEDHPMTPARRLRSAHAQAQRRTVRFIGR